MNHKTEENECERDGEWDGESSKQYRYIYSMGSVCQVQVILWDSREHEVTGEFSSLCLFGNIYKDFKHTKSVIYLHKIKIEKI